MPGLGLYFNRENGIIPVPPKMSFLRSIGVFLVFWLWSDAVEKISPQFVFCFAAILSR